MNLNDFSTIKGFFIDLEGVLYIGDTLIEGSAETVDFFKSKQIRCRFLTNTTTKSLSTLYQKLRGLHLPIERDEIMNAPSAAVQYLRTQDDPTCYLVLQDDPKSDFDEFSISETKPDYIIIGDIGPKWSYDLMNRLFRMGIQGSKLIALHKGRYWQTDDSLNLDIGAFIAGLEYATNQEAMVVGKPSTLFFEMALNHIGLQKNEVAMIGDDINSDIGGAQEFGIPGILVKTGKYRAELVESSSIKPDLIISSFAELRGLGIGC